MANKLAKHGSEAGYRSELNSGNLCDRCRAAHRVWGRRNRKNGTELRRYSSYDVIDHLDRRNTAPRSAPPRSRPAPTGDASAGTGTGEAPGNGTPDAPPQPADDGAPPRPGPSLSDRIRGLWVPDPIDDINGYVSDTETDSNLRSIDPDPEPSGDDWSPVADEEFVINAAGIKKIEDNLGMYLSVVGITMEMIDPYCGPILAENMEKMVAKWAKVISHYPAASKLFLDSKGGVLMAWIGAIQASWPFLYALYEHHLARTIRTHRDGTVERKVPNSNNFRGFDATTPPMQDEFAYTVR